MYMYMQSSPLRDYSTHRRDVESSTVSQRLQQLLNKVDPDINSAVHHTWLPECLVLVTEGREEGEYERLKGVRLETVQTTASRYTLNEVFSL